MEDGVSWFQLQQFVEKALVFIQGGEGFLQMAGGNGGSSHALHSLLEREQRVAVTGAGQQTARDDLAVTEFFEGGSVPAGFLIHVAQRTPDVRDGVLKGGVTGGFAG